MKKNLKVLFSSESLKNFIEKLKINPEDKEALKVRISQLGLKGRLSLFTTLTKIYLLDLEEKAAIDRIKKFWVK